MNITIPDYYKAAEILDAVKSAESGSILACTSERYFALLKIALVKLQRLDLTIQLVDNQGYMIKQVRTRKRNEEPQGASVSELTSQQIAAVKGLEAAFVACRKQGLSIVGFSDGLVAVPEQLGAGLDILSSTAALEIDAADAYRGYEADAE